jgi:hypothetical protein
VAERTAMAISAHHGEMVGQRALGLPPYRALAGDVRRAPPLRNDALQTHVAGVTPDLRAVTLDALGELKPGRSLARHVREDGAAVLSSRARMSSPSRCMRSKATSTAGVAFLRASAARSAKKSERPSSPTTMASPSITALRTFKVESARAMLGMRSAQLCPRRV